MTKKHEVVDPETAKRLLEEWAAEYYRTPKVPGICDECGGRIVKKVSSLFLNKYHFHDPACEKCGAVYRGVEHAPEVGVEEFERMLRTPFTC